MMPITLSQKFLSIFVHDLKNPLNVIGLTYRLLESEGDSHGPDFQQDIAAIRDNAATIDRILVRLNDYIRLHDEQIEDSIRRSTAPFDPRRMLAETLEIEAESPEGIDEPPAILEILETCPSEVAMDQARARLAIACTLRNARAAAGGVPVRLRSLGSQDRWIIEVIVPTSPPEGLRPIPPDDRTFDRLVGHPEDRRALDMATASLASELLGGSARLELTSQSTVIVLDWPVSPR